MFLVGKIIATHGIKGEVKIKSETNFDRFKVGNELFIYFQDQYLNIIVNSHRIHQKHDLITFNGLKNINDVLPFINCNLYVNHDYQDLENGEYYYEDLISLKVYNQDGYIGNIINLIEVPQGLILEINYRGKMILIPYVSEFVRSIDLENKKMIIETIEGLL